MGKSKKISILDKLVECSGVDKNYPLIAKYPDNLMIEVTNACNLKCSMCYHRKMKRKVGFMSKELFTKIIEEAKELNVKNIGLYTTGEAFLHPQIFDFIKIAKDKGIEYVYITTNGQALNKEKIQKILDSGLDSIKFSIDAASKSVYEKIRTGGKWERLIENIRLLREARDKSRSDLMIFGSFVITKDNYKDLLKCGSVFKNLIDESIFSSPDDQGGQQINEFNSMFSKAVKENFSKFLLPKGKWYPCNLLWNRFIVNYDGKLTICCSDFEAELIYGDLNKHGLKECWNNKQMQTFRKIHRDGKFELLPMCNRCNTPKMDKKILNKLVSNKMFLTT